MKGSFHDSVVSWRRVSLFVVSVMLVSGPAGGARTWTDTKGRTIDAEMVRSEGNSAIVNRAGKELKLPLDSLSEVDRKFVEGWRAEHANDASVAAKAGNPAVLTLGGKTIQKGGTMNLLERPFREAFMKNLSKEKDNKETTLKLAVGVPADFNPAVPQKYFVVVSAVNSEEERAGGNIAKFGMYAKSCIDAGWVCLAIDCNTGVPKWDCAMDEAFEMMGKEWVGFNASSFATGGFSGGSKGCWWHAAYMAKKKLNVAGVFMAGCNAEYSEDNRKKLSASAGAFRKIRGYVSMGKADTIATVAQSEAVMASLKSNGIRKLKSGVHDGGHSLHQPHFDEALRWFAEPE